MDLYNQQQVEKFEKRDMEVFGNAANHIVSVGINALNICEKMAQTNHDLLATNQQLANTADKAIEALGKANENQQKMVEDMRNIKQDMRNANQNFTKFLAERESRLREKENQSKSYVDYTKQQKESKSRDNSQDRLNSR